jgi:hypothetical protein
MIKLQNTMAGNSGGEEKKELINLTRIIYCEKEKTLVDEELDDLTT